MMSCRTGRLRLVTPPTKISLWEPDSRSFWRLVYLVVVMTDTWEAP